MTPKKDDTQTAAISQTEFRTALHEKLRQTVRLTLVMILEDELTAFLGAEP